MKRIINVYDDLQAESVGWLFKSPLAGGGGTLCRPHHRAQSLFVRCQYSHSEIEILIDVHVGYRDAGSDLPGGGLVVQPSQ